MLRAQLQQDQVNALKAGEKVKLDSLRFLMSQVKNKEIEKKSELDDAETLAVIRKNVKELKESLESFQKAERTDLAQLTQEQLNVVTAYLPKELSDEELKKEVQAVIEKNKDAAEINPKRLIGTCVAALKDKAEPSRIIQILQSLQK